MNENLNLKEILKGCEGYKFYSTVYGYVILIKIDDFIRLKTTYDNGYEVSILLDGRITNCYDGECTLFPSKEQRDWNKFERPIPVDTPMMCSFTKHDWCLRYYMDNKNGCHSVFANGNTSYNGAPVKYDYIIPFDKFNPNDIEESLKYNIQK